MSAVHAQIYVVSKGSGTVGEYDPSGATISASLVGGLGGPTFVTLSGSNLYVSSSGGGTVGEYSASTGAAINASLVTGLSAPAGTAISGGNLYIANGGSGTIGEYNATTGAVVNASLVTGLSNPGGIVISGTTLYVANFGTNTILAFNATTGASQGVFASGASLSGPTGLFLSSSNLYVANSTAGTITEYNATGTLIGTIVSGLSSPQGIAISGPGLYVTNNSTGTIGVYDAITGAVINPSLVTGLAQPGGIALLGPPTDVGTYNVQRLTTYDQTDVGAIALDPETPYQFNVNVSPGSSGALLSFSTLAPPSGSTGAITFQASSNGLQGAQDFGSESLMETAFPFGTYTLTIQTSTPNTYSIPVALGANNYPSVAPELTNVTNSTWVNGHLQITDPTLPTTFSWPVFNSSNGNIFFEVDGNGQSFASDGTQTSITIPGNTFTNNTAFTGSLNFTNSQFDSGSSSGISGGTSFAIQVNFLVNVGTPTASPSTFNVVDKGHVVLQTSNNTPANNAGDNDAFSPGPYNFHVQSSTSGTVTGASTEIPLNFSAEHTEDNVPYRFNSGPIPDQQTLDSNFTDGTYNLTDGQSVTLSGGVYPNMPQITQVNGATPVWNAQGQLVLNPGISNTITWTAINVVATNFAANGHEEGNFQSVGDTIVGIKQLAGVGESSNAAFNTLTIPANTMTAGRTYAGSINYYLASSVISPASNVFDSAGYDTENDFVAIASLAVGLQQAINFPALNPQQVTGSTATLLATASSGLPVTFSVVSGPATLTGNVLTFTNTGSVTVQAVQSGNGIYQAAPNVTQTFTVNSSSSTGATQTINFPTLPATQNAGIPLELSANASSGLPIVFIVTTGPATVNGNVLTFTGTGAVTINATQPGNGTFAAATPVSQSIGAVAPTDIGSYFLNKQVQYDQSSASAPVLDPEGPYQFQSNVNPGSTGGLLSNSILTPASGPTGTLSYNNGPGGLNIQQRFQTKAALDTAFPAINYNLSIQTDIPNTYTATVPLGADNYPATLPQITSITNANWTNGHLVVVDPALPVVFTWPAFNSAVGNINFQINNTSIEQNFASDGTHTSFSVPGGTFTNNTLYQASLNFQNNAGSTAIGGVNGSTAYQIGVQFVIQVGTPTANPSRYSVMKTHVLMQTSAGTPVNTSGDTDGSEPAPYNLRIESPVAGTTTAPGAAVYTLNFSAGSSSEYRYSSGTFVSQPTLDSVYPDGNYTLADSNVASLTGDTYPNTPQITTVNGGPPIWNSHGQLVLDPSVTNVITWTAFSISAGTFASNGFEEAELQSAGGSGVDIEQEAGVSAASSIAFTTLTIPSGTMINEQTYLGRLDYIQASTANSPIANTYDLAGYQTETNFTVLAQPLPTALAPTFNAATDIGVTASSYIATGINLTINLNFAPTAATTLTVINNTGSGPITGTFSNVAEGGTFSTVFGGTTYNFTATYHGGDGNDMTLTYTPPLPPSSVTIIHSFADGTIPNDGAGPLSTLIPGADGNFYGVTINGGANNAGTAFKLTPAGQVTILHNFGDSTVPNDGQNPAATLVLGVDGNFYGTTIGGGIVGQGAAFKMTPQGQVTILHSFNDGSVPNDGQSPSEPLTRASDGNFYSTTSTGGATGGGTVYMMTPTGQVTILHSFNDGSVPNDGSSCSSPIIQAADGNFYGTTQFGGTAGNGTVFKVTTQGQVTILHSFGDGTISNDGRGPQQGLVQGPDGNFYGMTGVGGPRNAYQGAGIIYKITPQGTYTILHNFSDGSVPNDGQVPTGELILGKDGNYYGMTQDGGGTTRLEDAGVGTGTIFVMTPQGVVTILHSFADGSVLNDGAEPIDNLVQASDGTFYGITQQGGSANSGVVFKFTPGLPVITSGLTVNGTVGLSFNFQVTATNQPTSYSAINLPQGLTINAATGVISGIPTTDGTSVAVITTSNSKGPASSPLTITISLLPPPVITSILTAYGTSGTPFNYTTFATNNPTSFSASGLPTNLSIDASSGVISGTPTVTGDFSVTLTATNTAGDGNPVTLLLHILAGPPTASQVYNVLYSFNPDSTFGDGASPTALLQAFDGTFYGVSTAGGQNNSQGTIFNITKQGVKTTFNSFGSGLGDALASAPQGLLQSSDGSLYGTTLTGGTAGLGTIFRISPDGTLTILHSFGDGSVTNDGASPQLCGLTQGIDGNFYGVTKSGGSAGLGTVYRITPLGVLSILHSFGDSSVASDGSTPQTTLLQGTDGNFYGTTKLGGAAAAGTIFKVTPVGTVTILHSFNDGSVASDGINPHGSLIQATDGNFYGTTKNGGVYGLGTVFKMTSGGTVTLIHSFGDPTVTNDGANPIAGLVQGFDSNFYGTTNAGGPAAVGTVFEMTSAGVETIIHEFADGSIQNDGYAPTSPLVQDADGNIYGTTSSGGADNNGTVFTFVTTLPTSHVPVFTGAKTVTSATLTPLSFTPKSFFGVSASGDLNGSSVLPSIVPQIIRPNFSNATSWVLTGTLPQFLSFDSFSGTITGTPIQAGTYTISMMSVNASGTGASATVTIFVDVPPTITSSITASGSVGTPFTYPIAANANPTSFGATGLPSWLTVDTVTGIISGTPPGAGTYLFSPTATNVAGTSTQLVTLTVGSGASNAPAITSAATTNVVVGTPLNFQITATQSPTSYTALSLPSGLAFNTSTGLISGTPTSVGTYSVPISATNGSGTSSSVLMLTVDPAVAPVITSSSVITCTPTAPVTYQITGTNAPKTFSAVGLPGGLTLNTSTGAITGTPMSTGTSSVTLTASNIVGTGTATLSLQVQSAANLPTVTSPTNVSTSALISYNYQLVATDNPTSFAATGLPPGLTINTSTGVISGTPTTTGIYYATVYATSPTYGTGTASIALNVAAPTYAQWVSVHPGSSDPTAEPDHDGVPNLLKYCFDIDPTHTMTATDRAGLPSLGLVTSGSNEYATISFRESQFETGVTLNLQSSSDLKTWTNVTSPDYVNETPDPNVSGDMMMSVGVKTTHAKMYLRLNAATN